MTQLASIDEACDASPSEKNHSSPQKPTLSAPSRRSRSKSRTIFVASRRSRIRSGNRNSILARHRKAQTVHQLPTDIDTKEAFSVDARPPTPQRSNGDREKNDDMPTPSLAACQNVDGASSEVSVDLEQFPVPPTGSIQRAKSPHPIKVMPQETSAGPTGFSAAPQPAALKADQHLSGQPKSPAFKTTAKHTSHRVTDNTAATAVHETTTPKLSGVDTALVEAISRNIAQQLRLLSLADDNNPEYQGVPTFVEELEDIYGDNSRSSSQRAKLNRFTGDLQRYADNIGAKGKILNFTPTPTRSGATLRTVSALMPFRPEFREAGLAVTSRDQAQRVPPFLKRNQGRHMPEPMPIQDNRHQMSQLDGKDLDALVASTTRHGSFLRQTVDDWSYAAKRERNLQRTKTGHHRSQPRSRCLPCFPGEGSQTTDGAASVLDPIAANMGSMAAMTSRMLSPPRPGASNNPRPPRLHPNFSGPQPNSRRNTSATLPMRRRALYDGFQTRSKPSYPGGRHPPLSGPSARLPAGYDHESLPV